MRKFLTFLFMFIMLLVGAEMNARPTITFNSDYTVVYINGNNGEINATDFVYDGCTNTGNPKFQQLLIDYPNVHTIEIDSTTSINGGAFNDVGGKIKRVIINCPCNIKNGSFCNEYTTLEVVINVPNGMPTCEKGAFDFNIMYGQTDVNKPRANLLVMNFESLPDSIKREYTDNPYLKNNPILTWQQFDLDEYQKQAENGWQQFVNNNVNVIKADITFRTFSSNIDRVIPKDNHNFNDKTSNIGIAAYAVIGYTYLTNKDKMLKYKAPHGYLLLYQLNKDNDYVLPANNAVLLYSYGNTLAYKSDVINTNVSGQPQKSSIVADGKPNLLVAMSTLNGTYQIKPNDYDSITPNGVMIDKTKITYRNFFLGRAANTIQPSFWTHPHIAVSKGNSYNYDDKFTDENGKVHTSKDDDALDYWSFWRCIPDRYSCTDKGYLHLPHTMYPFAEGGIAGFNRKENDFADLYWAGTSIKTGDFGGESGGYYNNHAAMGFFYVVNDEEHQPEEVTTYLNSIKSSVSRSNDKWYTVSGLNVNKPTEKGIYIKNGKKYVIK